MDHGLLIIILASVFGLLMTWGVGANDLANVMSTTMGSKAISVRSAIIIALVFEFLGAFLGGTGVTDTLHDGIINMPAIAEQPRILIHGMLAVLLAGTVWINAASHMGLPVSITNAIVGSIIGFGALVLGVDDVHWHAVSLIAISWICSPSLAALASYFMIVSIQRLFFAADRPLIQAQRYLPSYFFLVGMVLAFMTILKGLQHFHIELHLGQQLLIIFGCGLLVALFGLWVVHRAPDKQRTKLREQFLQVEKMFAILMVFTASAMVFAHGSNDVSVAVGPMMVIVMLVKNNGQYVNTLDFPAWITLLGCFGVVVGFLFHGRKVIETVGRGITALTPSRAFAATFSAATTVIISTSAGIPVSATQTLVGAVLGVGLARGIGALNLTVVRNIFLSWFITIPVASLLTVIFFKLLQLTPL
jgi:PiT family inorganic phosphate transporter